MMMKYGWAEREEVNVLKHTNDLEEAKNAYKFFGGVLDESLLIDE